MTEDNPLLKFHETVGREGKGVRGGGGQMRAICCVYYGHARVVMVIAAGYHAVPPGSCAKGFDGALPLGCCLVPYCAEV